MIEELRNDAHQIAKFLKGHLTPSGITDPDQGVVLEHSYTTAFFAWLSALLYSLDFGKEWLDSALHALACELTIIEKNRTLDLSKQPYFHWEFKNLALINCLSILEDDIPASLREQLSLAIRNWRELNINSSNWRGMRVVSYKQRYKYTLNYTDRVRSKLELEILLGSQTSEGFFPDTPDSFSFQYHSYILALLAYYLRFEHDERVKSAFMRGVFFIADFVNPAGDFNYYGRGQRQLFGYASLLFALGEAAFYTQNADERASLLHLQSQVYHFIDAQRNEDGVFPLAFNNGSQKLGWYEYNLLGDYLAFAGVWFLLTQVPDRDYEFKARSYAKCYPNIGLACVNTQEWFAAFSIGGKILSEPSGLIHLWPTGPFCLGGPEQDSYENNYVGPQVNGRMIKKRQKGQMQTKGYSLQIYHQIDAFSITDEYTLGETINLKETLTNCSKELYSFSYLAANQEPVIDALQMSGSTYSPSGDMFMFKSSESTLKQQATNIYNFVLGTNVTPPEWQEICNKEKTFTSLKVTFFRMGWLMWVYFERAYCRLLQLLSKREAKNSQLILE